MWSTSLSCLYPLDALNVKKRCGIVYSQGCALLAIILLCELNSVQAQTILEHGINKKEIAAKNEDPPGEKLPQVYPFYENGMLKLNITWNNFTGPKFRSFKISVHRLGPPELQKCSHSSESYTVLNKNVSYIIIPETNIRSTFFLSNCMYKITTPLAKSKNKILQLNYTIPGTSVVQNITAFSFYDENDRTAKINVSWEKPTGPLLPTGYHIKLIPNKENMEHCENHTMMDETYVSENIMSVVLQKNIIPKCTYTVEVEEQPANDSNPPSINYTVPECVGGHCTCLYLNPNLKAHPPNISVVQLSNDIIRIFWTIPSSNMANLTAIKFRVSLAQHNKARIITRNITDQDVETEMSEDVTVPGMKTGTLYDIIVWYMNETKCESSPAHSHHYAQLVLQSVPEKNPIMVPIILILMIVFLLYALWKKRFCVYTSSQLVFHRMRRRNTGPQIRRIYQPTIEGNISRPYLAVSMQYNNLYIEKEIADEQERGKVDKYEISYKRLEFGKNIGKGAFGQVFLARAAAIAGNSGYTTVAVKTLNNSATPEEMEEFLQEIGMLKRIGSHPNIVTLLGCCTLHQPYCMIMEYLPFGDLLRYLRTLRLQYEQKDKAFLFKVNKSFGGNQNHDNQIDSDASYITPESIPFSRLPSETETEYTLLGSEMGGPATPEATTSNNHAILECVLDSTELQNFALQISRGMQHLESKQIVHRDLAARNVLIDENKVLKISDFGLSRNGIYINSKQKKVPLRWLSVEAIRDNLYTSKSDVWAYGVVLWEISTLGGFPYPTVADDGILPYLLKGKRLEKPENCTDEFYDLMAQCWSHSEDQRPSFSRLVEYLQQITNKQRVYVDFHQLNPSYVFPPTEEQHITQIRTENNVKTIDIVVN